MLHTIVVLTALTGLGANLLRLYREVQEQLHKRRSNRK
jgi:hypothetical protein